METLQYLALGDSYTIGESVPTPACWPYQLADILRRNHVAIADPKIIATTGWTTDELLAAITATQHTGHYDFVTLLIGVNDQYRGRSTHSYRQGLSTLLNHAIDFVSGNTNRVIMVSIPDWGITPFAHKNNRNPEKISAALATYNTAAKKISAAYKVTFVDITSISRQYGAESPMLVDDGLHPSCIMYTQWVQQLFPVAYRLLTTF